MLNVIETQFLTKSYKLFIKLCLLYVSSTLSTESTETNIQYMCSKGAWRSITHGTHTHKDAYYAWRWDYDWLYTQHHTSPACGITHRFSLPFICFLDPLANQTQSCKCEHILYILNYCIGRACIMSSFFTSRYAATHSYTCL